MEIQHPTSKQPIPENATCVFKGALFDVYQWEQKLYDGSTATFEKLKRPDSVLVFPVLPDGKILLTRQEQPGRAPFIGAAGGRVDTGEDPMTAVKRELLEETGYEASEFTLWQAQHPVSKIDWVIYIFIAKGLRKTAELHLDGGEKITPLPVTLDEFIEIGLSDEFLDRDIVPFLYEAKLYPEKRVALEALFRIN